MNDRSRPTIPARLIVALVMPAPAFFCPVVLQNGNPFHDFSIYDAMFMPCFLYYFFGGPVAAVLAGTALRKIDAFPDAYRGKRLAIVAFVLIVLSYVIPVLIKIMFPAFFYLHTR